MPFERRDSSGNAAETTIVTTVGPTDVTMTLLDSSGWPTGGLNGPFFAEVETEVIKFELRNGTLLTVAAGGRGWDNTLASTHNAGASISHVFTRTDGDEANNAVSQTIGQITAAGQSFVGTGTNQLGIIPPGADGTFYKFVGGVPTWDVLDSTDMSDFIAAATAAAKAQIVAQIVAGTHIGLTDNGTTLTVNVQGLNSTDLGDFNTQIWSPGDLKVSAAGSPQSGWSSCDGTTLSRTSNAALFAAIGTTFGVGDGSTTFNKPNYAGKVLIGAGGTFSLGQTGGSFSVTLSAGQLAAHTHAIDHDHGSFAATSSSDGAHSHTQQGGFVNAGIGGVGINSTTAFNQTSTDGAHTHSTTVDVPALAGTSGSAGSGTAVDITPTYGVANVFIKL